MGEIVEYHKNRTVLDYKFIEACFIRDERELLEVLQARYPNHAILMPNADLILQGIVTGIGGSVPPNWNGLTYDARKHRALAQGESIFTD
jgi:hypothetical protein